MLNKEVNKAKSKLGREILGIFIVTAIIAIFVFAFLKVMANSIVISYYDANNLVLAEDIEFIFKSWIQSISFVTAILIFVILFLFLVGQKISYLREIIQGIEALRTHRMNYEIPIEGNNEFTELAESINYLSRTERELQLKESLMREEKEGLIRALSHDIRTPLTAIMSYSEYMQSKENATPEEYEEYTNMMLQKAEQIKKLTDRLLNGGRTLEKFENGRFLMEQLSDEWEAMLEADFSCQLDLNECPKFSGEFDIEELRRIFDNLASNIKKYADPEKEVSLKIYQSEEYLLIEAKNGIKQNLTAVESNKIGLASIRKIVESYGGNLTINQTATEFIISIKLLKIN